MVPYRHSKLTELFKSSFEGDGKAVMVVNVNPFDTGFDENSHVMKFAAVAKDVATWRRVHPKLELRDISTFGRRIFFHGFKIISLTWYTRVNGRGFRDTGGGR